MVDQIYLKARKPLTNLSLVIPFYNEQEVLPALRERVDELLAILPFDVEVICVNDGSEDLTQISLESWACLDARIKVLNLARNFGHQIALTAGLDHVLRGDKAAPLHFLIKKPLTSMHIPPLEITRNRRPLHWSRFDAARIWHFLSSLRRRCPVRLFLLIVTLSAIYTFVILQYSFQKGRLAQEITYDDVDYFQDGLQRLNLLHEKGLIEFIKNYVRQPPHSPSASLLAAVGFILLGVHDWAPYAMNCVLVVILLWFTWSLAGGMPRLPQFILVVVTLPAHLHFRHPAIHSMKGRFRRKSLNGDDALTIYHGRASNG